MATDETDNHEVNQSNSAGLYEVMDFKYKLELSVPGNCASIRPVPLVDPVCDSQCSFEVQIQPQSAWTSECISGLSQHPEHLFSHGVVSFFCPGHGRLATSEGSSVPVALDG